MDLSFLVYFPLSNLKLYLILVFVMFFYCSNTLISGHPWGLTPGNPRAFAPRHLQIPPNQGQYSFTKSYHGPFPREHNLKGLPNCNVILGIIFTKRLTINICSKTKQLVHLFSAHGEVQRYTFQSQNDNFNEHTLTSACVNISYTGLYNTSNLFARARLV